MVDGVTQPDGRLEKPPFVQWIDAWTDIATYEGTDVEDPEGSTQRLLELWMQEIPGDWQRPSDARVRNPQRRYTRGNDGEDGNRRGEHAVEHEILTRLDEDPVTCLDHRIIDGVNAVPFSRDQYGGRAGNVEADLLLLGEKDGRERVFIAEVKVASNDTWYAVVELLRQMRLYEEAEQPRRIFHDRRQRGEQPFDNVPVTGLVLAPEEFYAAPGKRQASVAPAAALLRAVSEHASVDARLATWSEARRTIVPATI